jgi:putative selenate reductase molybdopterin-binding subunit
VTKAAQQVAEQIKEVAAEMLNTSRKSQDTSLITHYTVEDLALRDKKAIAPDGSYVTLEAVALESLHHSNQQQIMAVASYMSPVSPPPFAAQFAEVTVDAETGQVTVDKLVMALDCGRIVNPATASGQIEGGMAQALGYGVCEEMLFDATGRSLNPRFDAYRVMRADEMPQMTTIFVETHEPSHPFGVKAVAEIPMDGVAPAVANAVYDAIGVRVKELPLTPEKVWRAAGHGF